MKKTLLALSLTAMLAISLAAQMVTNDKAIRVYAALSSATTTSAFDVSNALPTQHTVLLVITGSPATCTAKLQGSMDGTNWADLSGSETCTSTTTFHVVNKPILNIRVNVTALTGGTSPTVTAIYAGTR